MSTTLSFPKHHLRKVVRQSRTYNTTAKRKSYGAPTAAHHPSSAVEEASKQAVRPAGNASIPLSRLSTSAIIRSLFLSSFFTRPLLFKTGLAFMKAVAESKSLFLNPDRNPLLRATLKPMIYDQFCAGTNDTEVKTTAQRTKAMGFSGCVLVYGKEMLAEHASSENGKEAEAAQIEQFKRGNLHTLSLCREGDWIGMKLSGAGPKVFEAMANDQPPSPAMVEALDAICQEAQARGSRIWIDAEQQAIQKAIDKWTIDLMRRWNRGPQPVIYNTIQAYLKEAQPKLQYQLRLAQEEGWTLAVKLVRGAYISHDVRSAIHDTKAHTDDCYNSIVKNVLTGTVPGFETGTFPKMSLLLAGHNSQTVQKALDMAYDLSEKGQLKVRPEFAQLQGMADDLGFKIVEIGEEKTRGGASYKPDVYKCLTWGSLQECMQYLVRRAIENRGAAERIGESRAAFSTELRRRFWGRVWRQQT